MDITDKIPDSSYSAGIHPKDIHFDRITEQLHWLRENITEDCIAIGECGLDSFVPIDQSIQENVFLKQIEISNEVKKPMIIHCVRKFYEVISFRKKANEAMIIHGFNKKESIVLDLLKNNFHLSFGKAVLYNLSLQNTLKITPLNRIFLETDNEDFEIATLYQKTAEIKGISLDVLNKQILENLENITHG